MTVAMMDATDLPDLFSYIYELVDDCFDKKGASRFRRFKISVRLTV